MQEYIERYSIQYGDGSVSALYVDYAEAEAVAEDLGAMVHVAIYKLISTEVINPETLEATVVPV